MIKTEVLILAIAMMTISMFLGGCGGASASAGTATASNSDPDDVHVEGDHIEMPDTIHFATDSNVILAESHTLLDSVVRVLRGNGSIARVYIVGHTDDAGEETHNVELSRTRADAVAAYLLAHGVTQELHTAGKGESESLCSDDTEECRYRNRRVEFIIAAPVEE